MKKTILIIIFLAHISSLYSAEVKKSAESEEINYAQIAQEFFSDLIGKTPRQIQESAFILNANDWVETVKTFCKEDQLKIAMLLYYNIKMYITSGAQSLNDIAGLKVATLERSIAKENQEEVEEPIDWKFAFKSVLYYILARQKEFYAYLSAKHIPYSIKDPNLKKAMREEITLKIFKYYYSRIIDLLEGETIPMGKDEGKEFPSTPSDIKPVNPFILGFNL
jgi:hypothetical protein